MTPFVTRSLYQLTLGLCLLFAQAGVVAAQQQKPKAPTRGHAATGFKYDIIAVRIPITVRIRRGSLFQC